MVDCGSLRCVQERRGLRKELLSWGKKIPVLIGLETIASEFADHSLLTELLHPFNCLETEEISDWEPQEVCIYCEGKIKFPDPLDPNEDSDSLKGNSVFKCTPELLPYCPQYYTGSFDVSQPLDLSSNGYIDSVPSPGSSWELDAVTKPHVELKIPHIVLQAGKCKKDHLQNGKKAYTEEELVTAVNEIRSGKLGTRRAAVLYGIPRSTLRNKIFKMESEEQQQQQIKGVDQECSEDSQHSESMAATHGGDMLHLQSYSVYYPSMSSIVPFHHELLQKNEDDWEKKLEQIRRKHNLNSSSQKVEKQQQQQQPPGGPGSELRLPLLHNLVRRMAEQRLLLEQSTSHLRSPAALETHHHQEANCPQADPTQSCNVSLKIPSYRPAKAQNTIDASSSSSEGVTGHRSYESGRIGEALKDIIVKTISEKVYKRKQLGESLLLGTRTQDENHPSKNCRTYVDPSSPSSSLAAMPHPNKRFKKSPITDRKDDSSSLRVPVKKTRPKRGQYRKYNSQLLMEAVRAVQRGEMSVHRAGSYYGVPHSTLEYKVKERHLLRQKKLKESQVQKDASSGASSEDSSNTNPPAPSTADMSAKSEKPSNSGGAKFSCKPLTLPWLQPYANGSPQYDGTGMNFFSSSFALSTPASELLRKLQHKVQNKSNSFAQDSNFLAGNLHRPNGMGSLGGSFLFIN